MFSFCEHAHTPCDKRRQSESIQPFARNGHALESSRPERGRLRASPRPRKLRSVRRFTTCLLVFCTLAAGCGNGDGGPTGGTGGDPLEERSAFQLSCLVDTVLLQIPIELSYRLDRPYVAGSASELTFSAVITFSEETAGMLIEAGVDKIDIISLQTASSVDGAAPSSVQTSLSAAPINDFDLTLDPDDDGLPGPQHLALDPVTVTSTADQDAERVELGLRTSDISMVLGDFEVPTDCVGPTLVGFGSEFPVEPAASP